jgi:hypothetical protein
MKKIWIAALIFSLHICTVVKAQDVDGIINRYVHFIGGEKRWSKMKTMTTSGEYDYGGIKFPFTTYAEAPDHYKFVVPFNGKYYAQGFDGTSGWKIDAFKNETVPTMLEGAAARAMANEADVELESPLIHYRQKGHQATYEGKDTVGQRTCYRVKFVRKNGEEETYYFHEKTGALVKKISVSRNVELQGAVVQTSYEDYRNVEGVTIPFKMTTKANEQVILKVTVTHVNINPILPHEAFKPE